MGNEITAVQAEMSRTLNTALENASEIITREYLGRLERYEIAKPTEEDLDIDIVECGKLYRLTKLVTNNEENFLHKLTTIVNVASSIGSSVVTIIKSNGANIDFYFGLLAADLLPLGRSRQKVGFSLWQESFLLGEGRTRSCEGRVPSPKTPTHWPRLSLFVAGGFYFL